MWSFKPYYKWNTFNTELNIFIQDINLKYVLNLIINGIPSIRTRKDYGKIEYGVLNLIINGIPSILYAERGEYENACKVLNLIINGIPSILSFKHKFSIKSIVVLNLIINGIPSIPKNESYGGLTNEYGFKPYYKWNTFNT